MNLLDLFGNADVLADGKIITPEQLSSSKNSALINAGLAMMAASQGGQPGVGRPSLGAGLLQGLQAGQQAFKSGIEGQVSNVLTAQKIAEAQRQSNVLNRRKELLANVDPARLNEAYAASLQSGDIELAKLFADQIKASRQVLKPGERLYEGDKVIAEGAADPEKRRLTGAVGNLALTMFGTNDVGTMTEQQLQAVDAEARRRNLERPPSVSVNVGGEKAFESEVGKADAKFFSDVSATGLQAQRGLMQIDQLGSILQRTGGGLVPALKGYAAERGIKLGDNVGDVEAATAIISQLVPLQRPAGAGTMSDKDVELFKSSLPNLIKTPQGNQIILSTMRAISQYDAKVAEIARRAMSGEISRPQARELMNSVPNPLSEFSGGGWSIKPAGGQ